MKSVSQELGILRNDLINKLSRNQKHTGEFELFATTSDRSRFYIGESPFLTAHIAYLLHGVPDTRVESMLKNAISFLEKLDYTGKRIYKFWYKNATGTDYPLLPFDLDDTAVANQALGLQGRMTVAPFFITNNRSKSKQYYTWLKPSWSTLFKRPDSIFLFAEYIKTYPLFFAKGNLPRMAEYHDSEIIARMNIYIMLAIMGQEPNVAEERFPLTSDEIAAELSSGLHYESTSMYYLTLAKFQKHLKRFDGNTLNGLASEIRRNLKTASTANRTVLLLSLALIRKMSMGDVITLLEKNDVSQWEPEAYELCVGNKKFTGYHRYNSVDFSTGVMIRLLSEIIRMLDNGAENDLLWVDRRQ